MASPTSDNQATEYPQPVCPPRLMTDGEGAQAHEAFKIFFELGDQRSVKTVANQLSKSVTLVHRWAAKFHWNERIDAANVEVAAIYRRETEKKAAFVADTLARQRLEIAAGNFRVVRAAQAKAEEVLRFIVVKEVQTSADGKTIIIKPNPNVRLGDAMRLLVGGNVAMTQADNAVNPKRPGRPGQKPDGSPVPLGGGDQPAVEIWLDGGDGTPLPLSMMPEPDVLDPNFHPDADDQDAPTPPDAG